jgi:hypothetical protein
MKNIDGVTNPENPPQSDVRQAQNHWLRAAAETLCRKQSIHSDIFAYGIGCCIARAKEKISELNER